MVSTLQIPTFAWTNETIDGKIYYVLINPTYCQIFWLHAWKHVFSKYLKMQQNIKNFKFDTTQRVYLSSDDFTLQLVPQPLRQLLYVQSFDYKYTVPHLKKISVRSVTIGYMLAVFIILLLAFVFGR